MEVDLKYQQKNISATPGQILLKFETEAMGSNQSVHIYKWRCPQTEDKLQ